MARVYQNMEKLRRFRSIPAHIVCLCTLLGAVPLSAAQAQGDPVAFLKAQDREVRGLLRDKLDSNAKQEARAEKLGKALSTLLDFEELARRSMHNHWETLQPEQRERFTALLRKLVERSYEKNLEATLDFEVAYQQAARKDDGWIVGTTARSRKNRRAPEVTIDYAMAQRGGHWKVFDVVTDGVSLVHNYRRQFDRIIKRQGFEALIEKMQKRLGEPAGL